MDNSKINYTSPEKLRNEMRYYCSTNSDMNDIRSLSVEIPGADINCGIKKQKVNIVCLTSSLAICK